MQSSTARKLAQIPGKSLIVGVDPHKRTHAAVMITQQAEVCARLKIENTRVDFEHLVKRAQAERIKAGADSIIFAIEAGSHCWRNLAYYLHEQKLVFRLISPYTLKRQREGEDLTRRKNDYRDAMMAAELLRTGKFTETRLLEGGYAELRARHQCYRRLRSVHSRIRNQIRALLDGVFPEFCSEFSDPCGQTSAAVLSSGPLPSVIASQNSMAFIATVRQAYVGQRLAIGKLEALHALAASSVGIEADAKAVAEELGLLVQQQRLVAGQLERVEHELREMLHTFDESQYLLSIDGLSALTAAGIMAEIGPFGNYRDAKDLVKLAGVNPTQSESGGKSQSHTPMSKKGRAGLRGCLWQGAVSMLRANQEYREWAEKMQNRSAANHPLHRREVLGAAMNKLLRLCFALVTKKQMYRRPEAEPKSVPVAVAA